MATNRATVHTPATMGNFGPGFDVMSLAIAWGGDRVTAEALGNVSSDEVVVTGASDAIPSTWGQNAAALAFDGVRARLREETRVRLEVEKGVPAGSGLGSSASSAAGGVLAALKLFAPDEPWSASDLLQAAMGAESGGHGDDVAAALLGGLAMVRGGQCMRWDPPQGLALAIVRPSFALSTRDMRAVLPKEVSLADAVGNLGAMGALLHAWSRGDAEGVARSLEDRLAAPHRRARIPFFEAAQEAAREAGALGIQISGSGPALFTVMSGLEDARVVAQAMADAVAAAGVEAEAVACLPESRHVYREELGWS